MDPLRQRAHAKNDPSPVAPKVSPPRDGSTSSHPRLEPRTEVPDSAQTRELVRAALDEASLAPSLHNTQPARWDVLLDGRVMLLEDLDRQLVASDPTRRDHLLSLGAAFEGLSLALTRLGWRLSEPKPWNSGARCCERGRWRPVAAASLVPCPQPDPLADWVRVRRTCRAPFAPSSTAQRVRLAAVVDPRSEATLTWSTSLAKVAALHDATVVASLSSGSTLKELRAWMHLGSRDAKTAVEGLTAPMLGLSPVAALATRVLLRPGAFALLRRLGLARALVSEEVAVQSATAVLVLHAPGSAWMLSNGRALYRLWLELARAGFSACPMSATLNVPSAEAALTRRIRLPQGHLPYAVLRVGPTPDAPPAKSPRIAAERLLLGSGAHL